MPRRRIRRKSFFSEEPPRRPDGTGLGLSACRNFVAGAGDWNTSAASAAASERPLPLAAGGCVAVFGLAFATGTDSGSLVAVS